MHRPIDCNAVSTYMVWHQKHALKRARQNDLLDGDKDASIQICHN